MNKFYILRGWDDHFDNYIYLKGGNSWTDSIHDAKKFTLDGIKLEISSSKCNLKCSVLAITEPEVVYFNLTEIYLLDKGINVATHVGMTCGDIYFIDPYGCIFKYNKGWKHIPIAEADNDIKEIK